MDEAPFRNEKMLRVILKTTKYEESYQTGKSCYVIPAAISNRIFQHNYQTVFTVQVDLNLSLQV